LSFATMRLGCPSGEAPSRYAKPRIRQIRQRGASVSEQSTPPEPEYARFLKALPEFSVNLHLLIWTLDGAGHKRSHFCQNIAKAVQIIAEADNAVNVYAGVGLSPADFGPHRRCQKKEIAGLLGLWADIDVQGPTHDSPNLAKTIDEALSLIRRFPLRP